MRSKSIHFVGIAGIGMSGIAQILVRSGYAVSGSDCRSNEETRKLENLGARIFKGHRKDQIGSVDVVVTSSAIAPNNVEVLEAKAQAIPILSRAQMLAELMRKKRSIVVAGAHGKTTTSALITTMLMTCGYDPTAVIGGRLDHIAGNAKLGTDDWFIAESDESDGSFLRLWPEIGVITSLDREHLEHYDSYACLEQAFVDFANRVPFDGVMIACVDVPKVAAILDRIERPVITYGFSDHADLKGFDLSLSASGVEFSIEREKKFLGTLSLPIAGKHNALNALAAIAVGIHLDIPMSAIIQSLSQFGGVCRRMEKKGRIREILVVDDYAHHPTEILATVEALCAKNDGGALRVLFQPHRYSRVGQLWDTFLSAFDGVDELILLPIYAASEKPLEGIDSASLGRAITAREKTRVTVVPGIEEGVKQICENASPGDVLVTMGAGDVTQAASLICLRLERKGQQEECGE